LKEIAPQPVKQRVFVGFGFGPLQAGLFVSEAFASGNFARLVVAEIDPALVAAVRANAGRCCVNVAGSSGIEVQQVAGVEIYNPTVQADRTALLSALAEAGEISTSLPAVAFYDVGQHSVASLIAEGIRHSKARACVIYAAENNNHAAEILQEKVGAKLAAPLPPGVQFLNTVIGKMSQVVVGTDAIAAMGLTPMTPGLDRAFLVEAFNRILISRVHLPGFARGIEVFIEEDDLLPFEEAKLYGHNAIHALLAYLGAAKGYTKMTEIKHDAAVMKIARDAFLNESGAALAKKYAHLNDPLFTEAGYRAYAEDLLERMTNPWLADTIARAARDPRRKLACHDRIFGTMDLALSQGIRPKNMARAALAGIAALIQQETIPDIPRDCSPATLTNAEIEKILYWLWQGDAGEYSQEIIACVCEAKAIQIDPETAKLYDTALSLRDTDLQQACEILHAIISQHPDFAPAYAHLGEVLWRQDKTEEASCYFRMATELLPHSSLASLGLFHTLWEMKEYQAALEEIKRFWKSGGKCWDYDDIVAGLRQKGIADENLDLLL